MRNRLYKALKYVLYAAASLFCLLILALWLLPVERMARNYAHDWLATRGVAMDFSISGISLRRVQIEHVAFQNSDDLTLDKAWLGYNLKSLWHGRAGILHATGLNIVLRQGEDGAYNLQPALPLLAALASGAPAQATISLPALPFDEILLEDALLTLQPQKGEPVKIVFSAHLFEDYSGSVHVLGAHIPLPDGSRIAIADTLLERENSDLPFTFSIHRIAHETEGKALFTPLHALGEIRTARENSSADGMIVISDLLDRWVLNLSGKTDMQTGSWEIAIEQQPVFFESGILQPDQLFPFLRGMVKDATGNFAVHGFARRAAHEAQMESGGIFNFSDINVTVKNTPIKGANGTITFASLLPLATAGEQSVRVDQIVLGLPLSGGALRFALGKDGTLAFSPSVWNWAGGKLKTSGVKTDLATLTIDQLTLSAENLAVEQLLGSFLTSGFSASGQLNGTLPVSFKNGKAMIRGGLLATPGGGVIRYVPPGEDSPLQKGQSFQTDLLLSAIENFHYDALSLSINSKDERIMEILLHLRGRNPQLYDGKMVELNIKLTGNLLEAVQNTLDVYSLPERLEDQLGYEQ